MSRRRLRAAFTLVELLVVITIIGMLMGLLMPAVQAARESGRRITCSNNMNQLSFAVINFESQNMRYPGYTMRAGNGGNLKQISWVVAAFPFMERRDIWTKWSSTTEKPTPFLENLVCPSDPPETNSGPFLSYVANCGRPDDGSTPKDLPGNGIFHNQWWTGTGPAPSGTVQINADYVSSGDGTSYTLLLSENIQATNWDQFTEQTIGMVWHKAGTNTNRKINGNKNSATATGIDYARPSSHHPGGVNVAFADRHTRFLREDIDYEVYTQLLTTKTPAVASDNSECDAPEAVKKRMLSDGDLN